MQILYCNPLLCSGTQCIIRLDATAQEATLHLSPSWLVIMIKNVSSRTAIKSRGIITSLNRQALGKEPSFRLLSDRFGMALQPSAQTYSLAMLGSMEPDPIAGFMHVTNIVIIPSGLRKCRASE